MRHFRPIGISAVLCEMLIIAMASKLAVVAVADAGIHRYPLHLHVFQCKTMRSDWRFLSLIAYIRMFRGTNAIGCVL